MLVNINGKAHDVPSDLSQITLGKFAQWYAEYGKALDEQLASIFNTKTTEIEMEIDLQMHLDKEALSWYSFFTGFDFFSCEDIDLTDMLLQYRITRQLLKESERAAHEYPMTLDWGNETWSIQDYRVVPGSLMSFNEIITGKEVVRQIAKVGLGKWDALVYLCCVYFRKAGERFTDELTEGERYDLMQTLPLDYAMRVAFFLSASMTIFKNHLVSSHQEEAAQTAPQS